MSDGVMYNTKILNKNIQLLQNINTQKKYCVYYIMEIDVFYSNTQNAIKYIALYTFSLFITFMVMYMYNHNDYLNEILTICTLLIILFFIVDYYFPTIVIISMELLTRNN